MYTSVRDGKLVDREIDIRSIGFCDRNWIVSRRKVRNLGDIVNGWKNSLLSRATGNDVAAMHVDEWQ